MSESGIDPIDLHEWESAACQMGFAPQQSRVTALLAQARKTSKSRYRCGWTTAPCALTSRELFEKLAPPVDQVPAAAKPTGGVNFHLVSSSGGIMEVDPGASDSDIEIPISSPNSVTVQTSDGTTDGYDYSGIGVSYVTLRPNDAGGATVSVPGLAGGIHLRVDMGERCCRSSWKRILPALMGRARKRTGIPFRIQGRRRRAVSGHGHRT